jgi:hypothetical protein
LQQSVHWSVVEKFPETSSVTWGAMNATYLMLGVANERVQFWQDELQAAFRTGNTARAFERDRLIEEYGLLGETTLLLKERHAIGAESAESVMLARISSATVIRLLHADNVFALKMLTETSRRLRTSMLDTTARSSQARDRVIGFLLDEIDPTNKKRGAGTLTLPAVKRGIASRLGMAGETLSRVFRELSRENLISVEGPRVWVKSVSRLRAVHSHNSSYYRYHMTLPFHRSAGGSDGSIHVHQWQELGATRAG